MNKGKLLPLYKEALRVLFPPACPCCGEVLAPWEYPKGFCGHCAEEIIYITEPVCKVCGKRLKDKKDALCHDCSEARHVFVQNKATFLYTDGIKTAMYGLKYGNRKSSAGIFAKEMAGRYAMWAKQSRVDVIVPVPMYGPKRRARGYDQAALLAKHLAWELGIPYDGAMLYRSRATRPQKELNDTARRKNLKNAFKIGKSSVKSKRVLLVDDIYTTGATLDACAEVLLSHGADAVFGMTVVIGAGM